MTAAPLAFFEFAPAGGAGMTAACACTTPTGAKGEVMTFTRTGAATCSKQGLAATGINDGDLVVCGNNNEPRVEPSGGVLGLRVESARTNVCLRSAELCNATWADVGTPNCASDSVTGPLGTQTMDTLDDNDGAAFEGRSQSVTVSAATAYVMTCFVKAGTQTAARLSLDGTTADCTGLSTTTSTRCQVADASSSGVSISAQVLVGDGTGDTGTIYVEGCQVEAGTYATSYIPTVAAAATRNVEAATVALSPDRTDTTICMAATVDPLWTASGQVPAFGTAAGWAAPVLSLLSYPAGAPRFFTTAGSTGVFQAGRQRLIGRDDNTNITLSINGTTTSVAAGVSADRWTTTLHLGSGASGAVLDSIVTRVQVDPNFNRCSP